MSLIVPSLSPRGEKQDEVDMVTVLVDLLVDLLADTRRITTLTNMANNWCILH